MVIPTKYRQATDAIINYDFVDIISETGYISVYGFSDEANNKLLIRQVLESSDVKSQVVGTSGNVEVNFDYEFNKGAHIKGDMYVTITIFADGSASNAVDNDTTIEIFHFDGSTETTIGTQQAMERLNNPVSTAEDQARYTAKFAVDKRFSRGDKLRVEVISTLANSSNVNNKIGFYHDPKNRDFSLVDQHGAGAPSNLIVTVPFKIET